MLSYSHLYYAALATLGWGVKYCVPHANCMKNYVVRVFLAISMVGEAYVSMASGDAGVVLPEDVMPQLKPLIEQAMRQSPRMLEQNLNLAQSEADWYMARAASLPSVGGYAVYQLQQETRADAVRENGKMADVSSRTD